MGCFFCEIPIETIRVLQEWEGNILDISIFLKGLLIGFSIAIPVGPISVLIIRRTLANGRLAGLFSGLGAASADAFYGSVAAFGLTSISNLLVGYQDQLRLLGGGFLVYLGLRTMFTQPVDGIQNGVMTKKGLAGNYMSAFLLTLTNPMTILSFAAIFAGLGIGTGTRNRGDAAAIVLGVFSASVIWWLSVSGGIGVVRRFVTGNGQAWINRISGAMICMFGLAVMASKFI